MKRLILSLAAAFSLTYGGNSVSAAAINLVCTEKKGIEKSTSSRSGETTKELADLWSIPIAIDLSTGRATMWGRESELTVEASRLILASQKIESNPGRETSQASKLELNRQTLSFNYRWFYFITDARHGISITSSTTRASDGTCKKIQKVKGSKI